MRVSLLSITAAAVLLLGGCASKSAKPDIDAIESQKEARTKQAIKLAYDTPYHAYLDDDDKVRFVCFGPTGACGYFDAQKHDYRNGTPDEERFWFGEAGYQPPVSTALSKVQCGKGSLWGWVAIFMVEPFGVADYDRKNPVACYSRFTTLESSQMGQRFGFGLLTFMTPFLTGGNMHTVKYDNASFVDAVAASRFESYRKELVDIAKRYGIDKAGMDVIYLDPDDLEDDLEAKYSALLKDRSLKKGVVFLDARDRRPLAVIAFDAYKGRPLLDTVSGQISALLEGIAESTDEIGYDDVAAQIPPEVSLPELPPLPTLSKDEFETKKQFEARTQAAIAAYKNEVAQRRRDYERAVFERNAFVDALGMSYRRYLQRSASQRKAFVAALESQIPMLSKVLFLENTSGFDARDFRYDAETKRLFFELYSKEQGFSQHAVAKVPAEAARAIKRDKAYRVVPKIDANAGQLRLSGFELLSLADDERYDVRYTDIRFEPQTVTLRFSGIDDTIARKVGHRFAAYRQVPTKIAAPNLEGLGYYDVVGSVQARVPEWFQKSAEDKVVGFGTGKTLQEAREIARSELAYIVKVNVSAERSTQKVFDKFRNRQDFKERMHESTDIELNVKNHRLYRQEKLDGNWYVGYEYIGKIRDASASI